MFGRTIVLALITAATATGVSGLFAATLLRRWWERGRGNPALLVWGVALIMFCVASAALVSGVVGGWTDAEFRTFYLFGAMLNVPWLALGSITVNAPRVAVSRWSGAVLAVVAAVVARQAVVAEEPALWWPSVVLAGAWALPLLVGMRRVAVFGCAAVIAAFTVVSTWLVVTTATVTPLPAEGLPEGAVLFAPQLRGWAIAGNSVGAVTVVVSALVASTVLVWRRPERQADRRLTADTRTGGYADALARWLFSGRTGQGQSLAHLVRGNLMIAAGVAIAAAGGVLSFLGDTVGHAIGFTIGVTVMYGGFVRTTRPVDPREGL